MVCVLPCHIYFKPERWPIQRARKSGRRKLGIQVSGWHWVLKPVAMRARADMRLVLGVIGRIGAGTYYIGFHPPSRQTFGQ